MIWSWRIRPLAAATWPPAPAPPSDSMFPRRQRRQRCRLPGLFPPRNYRTLRRESLFRTHSVFRAMVDVQDVWNPNQLDQDERFCVSRQKVVCSVFLNSSRQRFATHTRLVRGWRAVHL